MNFVLKGYKSFMAFLGAGAYSPNGTRIFRPILHPVDTYIDAHRELKICLYKKISTIL